jgi:hypothetical protein
MRKIFASSILFSACLFIFSCGSSASEEAKQKKTEDSLAAIERNSAINSAEKLLAGDDSTATHDSIKK